MDWTDYWVNISLITRRQHYEFLDIWERTETYRGGSIIKKANLAFAVTVVVAFVESAVILLVNQKSYANLIDMTWFIVAPFLCLILGWLGIVKGRAKRVIWVNLTLLMVTPIMFFLTLPHVTYQTGQELVSRNVGNQAVQFVTTPIRDVSVVYNGYALLLHHEFYYYEVSLQDTAEHDYYMVNPMTGRITQLKTGVYRH